ncbi:hypothetical protein CBR_g41084 [Chara braunii]|uniref:RING-type domain-containing protein n=1 Tax=Chara braunii TaxID=69332 RepID=A0A388LV32_CHABU|nr:hypothetical protein CBR_g41084 [Chara braunii]|eukprot:GBG86180.1 hypothetical protein CBR_g41084 [Chara braunii]
MLVTSVVVVGINWKKYETCGDPLHIWTVVDYGAVFVARILMFTDNFFVASLIRLMTEERRHMTDDLGGMAEYHRAMTVAHRHRFYIYRIRWLFRRQHHQQLVARGAPQLSELQLIFDLVRNPRVVDYYNFRGTVHPPEPISSSTVIPDFQQAFPVHVLTPVQEFVASMIQQLPRFELKTIPTECPSCAICLEDFVVGTEVRLLPCAHNFHVNCIDQWLLRTSKCPQCRCSIFLDHGGGYSPLHVGSSPLNLGSPIRAALFGSSPLNIASPLRAALFGSSPYRSYLPSSPLGRRRGPSAGSMSSIPGSPMQPPSTHNSPHNPNPLPPATSLHRPAHSLPTSHLSIIPPARLPGAPYPSGTIRATGYPSPLQAVIFQQGPMRTSMMFSPTSMPRSVPGSPLRTPQSPLSPNNDVLRPPSNASACSCSRATGRSPSVSEPAVSPASLAFQTTMSSDAQRGSSACSPQAIGIPTEMQLCMLVPSDSPLPSPAVAQSPLSSPATVAVDCEQFGEQEKGSCSIKPRAPALCTVRGPETGVCRRAARTWVHGALRTYALGDAHRQAAHAPGARVLFGGLRASWTVRGAVQVDVPHVCNRHVFLCLHAKFRAIGAIACERYLDSVIFLPRYGGPIAM